MVSILSVISSSNALSTSNSLVISAPPQQTGNPASRQGMPNNAPVKSGAPNNLNACYHCGEVGHYAHQCPKKQNQQAPQNQNGNLKCPKNARPPHTAKVNYVSFDAA